LGTSVAGTRRVEDGRDELEQLWLREKRHGARGSQGSSIPEFGAANGGGKRK
jgi:hypothetical protein